MEEKNLNASVEDTNDECANVTIEEETESGTGFGVIVGSILTLAVIAGVKLGRKAIAKYKNRQRVSEENVVNVVEDDACDQDESTDTVEV